MKNWIIRIDFVVVFMGWRSGRALSIRGDLCPNSVPYQTVSFSAIILHCILYQFS